MPPSYKPLSAGVSGISPEIFGGEAMPLTDSVKAHASLRAQALANERAAMIQDEQERQFAREAEQQQLLKSKYGHPFDPNGPNQEIDPQEVIDTIQRTYAQTGDVEGFLNAAKLQNSFSRGGDRVLDQTEIDTFNAQNPGVTPLPPGATLASARLWQSLNNSGLARDRNDGINNRFNDPNAVKNRQFQGVLAEQRATGTQFQKVSDTELGKLENADGALQSINEVSGLLPQLDPGALSALRAGRVTDLYKDPGSPAYRMNARLELLKKQVARMNDSGALTELDVSMFEPFTVGSPIYDSPNSIAMRMQDLAAYIKNKEQSIITRNEQGYRNMDRFKTGSAEQSLAQQYGAPPPPSSSPTPSPGGAQEQGEAALGGLTASQYKEQYKAKLKAQRGG